MDEVKIADDLIFYVGGKEVFALCPNGKMRVNGVQSDIVDVELYAALRDWLVKSRAASTGGARTDCELAYDLFLWQHGADHFTCRLYGLIAKADPANRSKLWLAFPGAVEMFEAWESSADPDHFFASYGIDK